MPTSVIQRALHSRRDLLSMNFDPLAEQGVRPEMSVAALELRSVVCLPLVQIRSGSSEETRMSTRRRSHRRAAVSGFARDAGRSFRGQSRAAANAGD